MLLRFLYLLLILLLVPYVANAQINTEAMRVASDQTGFKGQFSLTGKVSAGNTSIYEMNTTGRLDYILPRNRSFVVYNYEYGYKSGEPFKNASFIALRNTWQWQPRVAVEGFLQQQQDEFIRLKDRKLLGGGVRLTAINLENEQTGWQFRTFVGLAAMGEREVIEASGDFEQFTTNLIRSTNYLSLTLGKRENFYVSAVQYLQFVPDDRSDYRYTADVNMETRLYGNLSMLFTLSYRFDSEPPDNVRSFDLDYSTGLRFRF